MWYFNKYEIMRYRNGGLYFGSSRGKEFDEKIWKAYSGRRAFLYSGKRTDIRFSGTERRREINHDEYYDGLSCPHRRGGADQRA